MTKNDFFKPFSLKDFGISFTIHFLIILIGVIFSYRHAPIEPDKKLFKPKLTKKQKLLNSAVRVDVVAMPKLTVKELRKLRPPSRNNPKSVAALKQTTPKKTKTKVKTTKSVSSKNSFQNLLKNLSSKRIDLKNIKKKKAQVKDSSKKKKSPQISSEVKKQLAALNDLALEGNKISKGSQVISDKITLEEQKVSLERYAQELIAAVKPNWKLPSYLLKKNFNCQIRVYISENGDLINIEVYKSSGDKEFDGRAISAVEKSSPFDTPSLEIRSRLIAGEILLGFPL